MRVAVLADPGERAATLPLLESFKKLGISASSLLVGADWETLAEGGLLERLQASTHLLFHCSHAALRSTWLPFAAGWALGARRKAAVYPAEPTMAIPAYLSALPPVIDTGGLERAYAGEAASYAAEEARQEARRELLDLGVSFREDSLAECVAAGDLRAVELFLDAGLSPDAKNKHGVTMLSMAVRSAHKPIAELLAERGADLDLQSDDRGNSPLMDAVAAGNLAITEFLLSRGAQLDSQSKDGQSALVIAVGKNDVESVRKLLAAGANPDIPDKLGFSARKYAKLFHNEAIVDLLFRER